MDALTAAGIGLVAVVVGGLLARLAVRKQDEAPDVVRATPVPNLAELLAKISNQGSQIDWLMMEITGLSIEVKRYKDENTTLTAEVARLRNSLAVFTEESSRLSTEVKILQGEKRREERRASEYRARLAALGQQVE